MGQVFSGEEPKEVVENPTVERGEADRALETRAESSLENPEPADAEASAETSPILAQETSETSKVATLPPSQPPAIPQISAELAASWATPGAQTASSCMPPLAPSSMEKTISDPGEVNRDVSLGNSIGPADLPRPGLVSSKNSSATSSEIPLAFLSSAVADQLHASWANSDSQGFGLTTPIGFAGDSSRTSLNLENPLTMSRLDSTASSGVAEDDSGISSEVHDAARITNWERVKEVCEADPEAAKYIGRDGWTALHHACNRRCPHPHVVEALIRAYPDALLVESEKGWYPLHYACRFKANLEVIKLLLHMFPDKGLSASTRLDREGRTPLYYAVRYDAPAGVVRALLEVNASAVLEEDEKSDSAFALLWDSWAEKLDGKRNLQRILQPVEQTDLSPEERAKLVRKRLQTQKQVARQWNRANVFLKCAFGFPVDDDGADVFDCSAEEKKDSPSSGSAERKWRILHATAAIKCHKSLFQLASALYPNQAFEVDENDLDGPVRRQSAWHSSSSLTALHLASSSSANGEVGKSVLSQLISFNPAALESPDSTGGLPLHLIAANKKKAHWVSDGGQIVYEAHTRAAHTPNADGRLPLHLAASVVAPQGEATDEWIRMESPLCNLLEANPDAAGHADNFGELPMHVVAKHGSTWDSQVQALYDAFPAALRSRTGVKLGNCLPLHLVACNPNTDSSLVNRIVELHPRGASQAERGGKLPLHMAIETGLSWESIEAIHEAYPDAVRQTEQDSRGWTALHMAAGSKRPNKVVLSSVLELCRDLASRGDARGRYALHLALMSGLSWDDGLSALFHANPDVVGKPDAFGLLPFHLACFRYCSSGKEEPEKPAVEVKKHHRRHSSKVPLETLRQENAQPSEDARQLDIMFQLLRADPTVLHH